MHIFGVDQSVIVIYHYDPKWLETKDDEFLKTSTVVVDYDPSIFVKRKVIAQYLSLFSSYVYGNFHLDFPVNVERRFIEYASTYYLDKKPSCPEEIDENWINSRPDDMNCRMAKSIYRGI